MSVMEAVQSLDNRQMTLLTAGLSVLGACHLCTQLVGQHFFNWAKPREQMAIVYIILMVPVFAIDSYVGLVEMPSMEVIITILDSVKECYEAFAIYNFLELMYCYMGVSPDPKAPIPDAIKGRVMHHSFPVTLFQPREVIINKDTLRTLTLFTTQFVVIRPVFSILLCILELLGLDVPPFTWIITAIFNVSVYLAVYALLSFYHTFHEELKPHDPLKKFLCIKGVVFFSFWQGLMVQLFAYTGLIHEGQFPYTVKQLEDAVQYFLVCVEMLLFAFVFTYAYSANEYNPAIEAQKRFDEKQKRQREFYGLDEKKKKEKDELQEAVAAQRETESESRKDR